MNIELKTILDSLVSYLPLLSTTLILAGFLKGYLYFKYFGLNIIDYVELSEMVNLFMDNVIAFFGLFLYSLLISYLLFPQNLIDENRLTTLGLMFPSFNDSFMYYIILIIASIGLFIFYRKRKHIYLYELISVLISIWLIIPFAISEIILNSTKTSNSVLITSLLVLVSFCLIIYVILACYNEVHKVIAKDFYSNYRFKLIEDKKVKANFIGKTKGYFFFLNPKTKDVIIYPASEIQQIMIRKSN